MSTVEGLKMICKKKKVMQFFFSSLIRTTSDFPTIYFVYYNEIFEKKIKILNTLKLRKINKYKQAR